MPYHARRADPFLAMSATPMTCAMRRSSRFSSGEIHEGPSNVPLSWMVRRTYIPLAGCKVLSGLRPKAFVQLLGVRSRLALTLSEREEISRDDVPDPSSHSIVEALRRHMIQGNEVEMFARIGPENSSPSRMRYSLATPIRNGFTAAKSGGGTRSSGAVWI